MSPSKYFEQSFYSGQTSAALLFAARRRSLCFAADTDASSGVEVYTWTYSASTPEHEDGRSRDRGGLTPKIIRSEADISPVAMKSSLLH